MQKYGLDDCWQFIKLIPPRILITNAIASGDTSLFSIQYSLFDIQLAVIEPPFHKLHHRRGLQKPYRDRPG